MSYTELNIDTWSRRAAYRFFKTYEDPFFNLTAPVDVTALVTHCKATGGSFFLHCLHQALCVANEVDAFRYRILGDRVVVYDVIHAGSTILNDDHTFSFCYFDYHPDRATFIEHGQVALAAQKLRKGLDPRDADHNLIHLSFIPWVSFTSFKHARRFGTLDAVPKIVFGKYYKEGSRYKIPLSVEVHHALMDGYHVGEYFSRFEEGVAK